MLYHVYFFSALTFFSKLKNKFPPDDAIRAVMRKLGLSKIIRKKFYSPKSLNYCAIKLILMVPNLSHTTLNIIPLPRNCPKKIEITLNVENILKQIFIRTCNISPSIRLSSIQNSVTSYTKKKLNYL